MEPVRELLGRIIATGDVRLYQQIDHEHLSGQDRFVFEITGHHLTTYGKLPHVSYLQEKFPDWDFSDSPHPTGLILDELRKRHLDRVAQLMIGELSELRASESTTEIPERMQQWLEMMHTSYHTEDIDVHETWAEQFERAKNQNKTKKMIGIPTGFPHVDQATSGFKPGELIVLFGYPKANKSLMLLWSAWQANLSAARPFFVQWEMSNIEQEMRLNAFRTRTSYNRLKNGGLTDAELKALELSLRRQRNLPTFTMTSDSMGSLGISKLIAKIRSVNPDICFIDGVYLLRDEDGRDNDAARYNSLCQALKRAAVALGIPIVISTQALESKKRGSEILTTDKLGWSGGWYQNCNVLIGVERTANPSIRNIRLFEGRECEAADMLAYIDWSMGTIEMLMEPRFAANPDRGPVDAPY